jgi:hypothetical protein
MFFFGIFRRRAPEGSAKDQSLPKGFKPAPAVKDKDLLEMLKAPDITESGGARMMATEKPTAGERVAGH